MKTPENPLLDYEINTGKIFALMQLQKIHGFVLFNNNTGLYKYVLSTLGHILTKKDIITHNWEQLTDADKKYYAGTGSGLDTLFLRPRLKEEGAGFIEVYDVVLYSSTCILSYKEDNEFHEFRLFFALKVAFTDVERMDNLLNYQLKKNFKNTIDYCQFLDDALLAYPDIMDVGCKEKVTRYIKEHTQQESIELPDKNKFDTPIKAYTPKQLQAAYEVTAKTFSSWLKPHITKIGALKGRIYTPYQVQLIFALIGEPDKKP